MSNRENIQNKLRRYLGSATAVLSASAAYGQSDTILTVVDSTLDKNGQRFDIDLDTNGVVDFRITQIVDSTNFDITGVVIEGKGPASNQVLGLNYANYNYPFKLNIGDTIGPGKPFSGLRQTDRIGYLGLIVDGATYPNSQFTGGVTDGFLGVRFEGVKDSAAATFYGWIRVDVAADLRSMTIKDYAVITSPDSLIRAGFGSPLSQVEVDVTESNVELSQRANILDYHFPENEFRQAQLSIHDLSGRLIENYDIQEAEGSIDLSHLPKGVLVARMKSSLGEAALKVVVY